MTQVINARRQTEGLVPGNRGRAREREEDRGGEEQPSVCSAGSVLTQEAFNYLGCEREQLISRLRRFIDLPETFSKV